MIYCMQHDYIYSFFISHLCILFLQKLLDSRRGEAKESEGSYAGQPTFGVHTPESSGLGMGSYAPALHSTSSTQSGDWTMLHNQQQQQARSGMKQILLPQSIQQLQKDLISSMFYFAVFKVVRLLDQHPIIKYAPQVGSAQFYHIKF